MKLAIKRGALNIMFLMIAWLPVFIVAFLLTPAIIRGRQSIADFGGIAEGTAYYYLSFFLPVLVGGIVHQGLLLVAARRAPRIQRAAAMVTSCVIPLAVIVFGSPADLVLRFAPAIVVWLVTYCLVIRLPLIEQTPSRA